MDFNLVNIVIILFVGYFAYSGFKNGFIKELSRFKDAEFVWCQEEPKNQGGWSFVEPNLEWSLNRVKAKYKRARFIGRAAAASPATGLATQHKKQQEMIINEALTID